MTTEEGKEPESRLLTQGHAKQRELRASSSWPDSIGASEVKLGDLPLATAPQVTGLT